VYRYPAPVVKSNSTNSGGLVNPEGIYTPKATLTNCSVDGTNDDEACYEVECPEQWSERTQIVSLELYALAMEEDCNESEDAEGGHLEDESRN